MQRSVSLDHAKAVAAIPDPVLRNLWISLTYADISQAVRERVGVDDDGTWCTFGAWASNTVGSTIRFTEGHEAVRTRVEQDHELRAAHDHAVGRNVLVRRMKISDLLHPERLAHLVLDLAAEAGGHLADGNQLVFGEIGLAVAKWIEIVDAGGPTAHQREAMARFCADAEEVLGTNRLALGCDLLFDARETDDPVLRSQMLLTSSAQLGAHEQARLQSAIADTLNVPIDGVIDPLIEESLGVFHRIGFLRNWLRGRIRPVEDRLRELWHQTLTELILVYDMAGEQLHLGQDIPPPKGATAFSPPRLADPVFPPLVETLALLDRSDGEGGGTASKDWADYGDRMNYILNMFRSRQCLPGIYGNPFTDEQIAALERDEIPHDL